MFSQIRRSATVMRPAQTFRRGLAVLLLLAGLSSSLAPARAIDPPIEDGPAGARSSAVAALVGIPLTQHFDALRAGEAYQGAEGLRALAVRHRSALRQAEQALHAQQAPAIAAAEQLGLDVVSRYDTLISGLLLHGSPAQLAAFAEHPDVLRLGPAPAVRPAERAAAATSLRPIGPRSPLAQEHVQQQPGSEDLDGSGSIVAIIDTGIDYTHAALGGPGEVAAYQAALGDAESIEDQWEGHALFPTKKVVGGHDFVGPLYTHPRYCPQNLEELGRCRSLPSPDPDPLDQHDHGSHVAGIAAGMPLPGVPAGVAPEAKLVALKIYGPPSAGIKVDEEVDVVIDALDWVARVNLGLPVPGTAPPHVDVVNMSLGEPFGQAAWIMAPAVRNLRDRAGVVVVASAGNEGNTPFIIGAPGAVPAAISVANVEAVDEDTWRLNGGSSRGPALRGSLKPDISAPGSGIRAAGAGSGDSSKIKSGTSMSSPFAAGAAALLAQRNRDEALGLDAMALSALLVSSAQPGVLQQGSGRGGPKAPIVRQGSGSVNPAKASGSPFLAYVAAPGAALDAPGSVSFEAARPQIEGPTWEHRAQLQLVSLAGEDLLISAVADSAAVEGADAPLGVDLPDEPVLLPAGGRAALPLSFRIQADRLENWPLAQQAVGAQIMDSLALEGRIVLAPMQEGGGLRLEQSIGLPFSFLPRRASALRASLAPAESGESETCPWHVSIEGSEHAGSAALYALLEHNDGGSPLDPDEANLPFGADLWTLGARIGQQEGGGQQLELALVSHSPVALARLVLTELYLDADGDAQVDHRVQFGSQRAMRGDDPSLPLVLTIARWDPLENRLAGPERSLPVSAADIDSRLQRFAVPLADLGLTEISRPLELFAVRRGLTEDWMIGPGLDFLPDGARMLGTDAPRLRIDPTRWRYQPERWDLSVGPDGAAALRFCMNAWAAEDASLPDYLVLFPENPAQSQAQLIGDSGGDAPLWVPLLMNGR